MQPQQTLRNGLCNHFAQRLLSMEHPAAVAAPAPASSSTEGHLPAPNPHTLSSHHQPVHAPEVPLVLPATTGDSSEKLDEPAPAACKGLSAMRGKLKSAAQKVITDQRTKRTPSALFQEVVKEHRTQESLFLHSNSLLKRRLRRCRSTT